MSYRKGRRGLYYNEDGSLRNCVYNECRLNPFELYGFTFHNQGKQVLSDFIELLRDIFQAIFALCTIPFLGFLVWFHARDNVKKMSKDEQRKLKVRYPKDYFEELEY